MCGIGGILSPHVSDERLQRMGRSLAHRGPDGSGVHRFAEGGLVHRRLAILDLSPANAQPFERNGLVLVYNGELYNYRELRQELARDFRTTGDTEVVLAAYERWGVDCFRRFNGMWALAILDPAKRRLILSRDRFGIKPLYYQTTGRELAFASELKALRTTERPHEETVARYLRTGLVDQGTRTFYQGLERFPPGHYAEIDLNRPAVQPRSYWTPPERSLRPTNPIGDFQELFQQALGRHFLSDVPVGSCLSGGLDSSALVCGAVKMQSFSYQTYGYVDQTFSEEAYLRDVVRRTGVRLKLVTMAPEAFEDDLHAYLGAQDEPGSSLSGLAQWLVFRAAARDGVKVMLDGQGADELLAGYPWYADTLCREYLRKHSFGQAFRLWFSWLWQGRRLGIGPGLRQPPPDPLEKLAPRLAREFPPDPPTRYATLNDQLRHDVLHLNLPALLRFEDQSSMAHSIEARVPFLDQPLAEYALALDSGYKIRGSQTKWILRHSLPMPRSVRERTDKKGFWANTALLEGYVKRHSDALAVNLSDFERAWLAPGCLARAGPALWRLVNLKLWLRR